jgi:hypothetical protein
MIMIAQNTFGAVAKRTGYHASENVSAATVSVFLCRIYKIIVLPLHRIGFNYNDVIIVIAQNTSVIGAVAKRTL